MYLMYMQILNDKFVTFLVQGILDMGIQVIELFVFFSFWDRIFLKINFKLKHVTWYRERLFSLDTKWWNSLRHFHTNVLYFVLIHPPCSVSSSVLPTLLLLILSLLRNVPIFYFHAMCIPLSFSLTPKSSSSVLHDLPTHQTLFKLIDYFQPVNNFPSLSLSSKSLPSTSTFFNCIQLKSLYLPPSHILFPFFC